MKDKGIIITYIIIVVLGSIVTLFGFGNKDTSEDVSKGVSEDVSEERYIIDPLTNNALENIVLIHTIDYIYRNTFPIPYKYHIIKHCFTTHKIIHKYLKISTIIFV